MRISSKMRYFLRVQLRASRGHWTKLSSPSPRAEGQGKEGQGVNLEQLHNAPQFMLASVQSGYCLCYSSEMLMLRKEHKFTFLRILHN